MTTIESLGNLGIESTVVPLNALRMEFEKDQAQCRSRQERDRVSRIVLPDGRRMRVSERFWSSFSSLHNLGRSTFNYFSHAETFQRITQVKGNQVRVTYEAEADGGRMLSCTNPAKPLLPLDDVRELIDESRTVAARYADGVVTARFECPFPTSFQIGGDSFRSQFALAMPIDGYGLPAAFLALLRLVCENGMVAMSPAFKTVLQLGKESTSLLLVLRRAMETFNNEEGNHSLRLRIEAATASWASLNEVKKLRQTLFQACRTDGSDTKEKSKLLGEFDKVCGSPLQVYGLSGHSELSIRQLRAVPVEVTLYDLLNFASEAATHHLAGTGARNRIDAWIGDTVTQEYDLEGTVTRFPEFRQYFLGHNAEPQAAKFLTAKKN